ncbi:hypothetical protein BGZ76_002451 [Entomortierella beljakovae]|nr:hypothetical protein BGZ76_002451 [Entomortierella beljakovae]
MDTLDMPAFDINFSSNVQEFVGNISESRTNFPPNNLRRITLNSKILYSTFINILQSAPGLDYFSVEEIDISDSDYDEISDGLEDIVPIFLGEPSQLRKLNYMSKKVASYKCISILAHLFPNLVEFTGEYLESNLSYALALNCKSIEKVIIAPKDERMTHNGVKMGVDVITIFLISCRKLKILDAKLLWVDVTEILDEPWVCDNLEELHCRFEGFPIVAGSSGGMFEKALQKSRQKEKLTRAEGEEVRQWQHSCRLKREVFKRISKLTSLRKLTLHSDARVDDLSQSVIRDICFRTRYVSERDGKMYIRYNNSPQDSISMRLDEGLDELASLTKLQYLGFENLEHHMGKEEIEWIAANLPSLKEMRGLLDGAQIGVEPNYKNRELLALMKSLRSDITHTRRYRPKDIEVPRRHFIDPRSEHFMVDSLLY